MSSVLALASPLIALALVLGLQVLEEWAIGAPRRLPQVKRVSQSDKIRDPEKETTDEED